MQEEVAAWLSPEDSTAPLAPEGPLAQFPPVTSGREGLVTQLPHDEEGATAAAVPHWQEAFSIASGLLGLMADTYDLTIMNVVRPSLEANFGKLEPGQNGMLSAAALVGAVVGQICIGALADHFGRRRAYVITAILICVGSLGSAFAAEWTLGVHIYTVLMFWRFLVGFGIGGEWPLAAASVAENASSKSSSWSLALVTAGGSVGSCLGPLVVIGYSAAGVDSDWVWRPAFGFGALLAAVSAVFRYSVLLETAAFQAQQRQRAQLAAEQGEMRPQKATTTSILAQFAALWHMRKSVLGTSGCWFLYNMISYGIGLFITTIFATRPGLESANLTLFTAVMQLPGCALGVAITKYMSMRSQQLLGLGLMKLCFLLLPWVHGELEASFVVRYWLCLLIFSLMGAFDGMGPSVTMFSIPGQIFPTQIRGTAHGVSAATGKLGAAVGTLVFPYLHSTFGVEAVMYFMAQICLVAMVWTWIFTPRYGAPELEHIAKLDPGASPERQAFLAEEILFGQQGKETYPFARETLGRV